MIFEIAYLGLIDIIRDQNWSSRAYQHLPTYVLSLLENLSDMLLLKVPQAQV